MRKFGVYVLLVLCASWLGLESVNAQVKKVDGDAADLQALVLKQQVQKGVVPNVHPDAQWFPDAGLGLFIHWGITSTTGAGDLSWSMMYNKPWRDSTLTPNAYYALIKDWNPDNMNFNKMMKKAKAAGIVYAVLVTKHHDGFTLWPSKYGDLGTNQYFKGRDFVKEFVTACRKNNIKVGLYYSTPDWWFDRKYKNFAIRGNKVDMDHNFAEIPAKPADHDKKRVELVANHVTELLTNYGKIDLIWFDGGRGGEIPNSEVRRLQPGIVINRRNGGVGDYGDSEGKLPAERFSGWFETCETCWPSGKWSYSDKSGWDTAPMVITELVKLRAWGGNLLANVGPKGDGTVPEQALEAWSEMAKWMKHSSESVIGAGAGPWPGVVNTPITTRKDVAYVHFLPDSTKVVVWKKVAKPVSAVLLRNKKTVPFSYSADSTLTISLDAKLRTNNVDVVKLNFK